MARKKKTESVVDAPEKTAKINVSAISKTFRAIRDEAKVAYNTGGKRPISTILALVQTGLDQLTGKVG